MRRPRIELIGLVLWASVAHAGNDDEVLVGNDAAIAAGAMTAVIDDGSALYYNPAGLVGIEDDTIDVSGSAYTLRLYGGDGVLEGTTGERGGASFSEVVIVPSAVAYVRSLSARTRVGFGVFTLRQSDVLLRTELVSDLSSEAQERLLLTISSKSQLLVGILGIGWAATPELRLGAGLSMGYLQTEDSLQFGGAVVNPETSEPAGYFSLSQLAIVYGLAARLSAGLQWAPTSRLRFGLAAETPSVVFYQGSQFDAVSAAGSDSGLAFASAQDTRGKFSFEVYTPVRVRLGAAYTVPERWWVSLDVDAQPALTNDDLGVRRRAVFNARVGAEVVVAPGWSVGGGLFTDRSASIGPKDRIDYFGGTAGVRYRNDRRLDRETEEVDALTFETVVALRYAYGSGQIDAIAVNFLSEAPIREARADLEVHELGLHVGAGLHF